MLQKKAIRVVKFKSPIAHTEPILKKMNQLELSDMYTCYLLKLYYKLYRNRLPPYFENFIPVYGDSRHNLRNRCIHLPDIRCEFGKINAKYQMHVILRELATDDLHDLSPYEKCQNFVSIRQLVRDLHINEFNATSFNLYH